MLGYERLMDEGDLICETDEKREEVPEEGEEKPSRARTTSRPTMGLARERDHTMLKVEIQGYTSNVDGKTMAVVGITVDGVYLGVRLKHPEELDHLDEDVEVIDLSTSQVYGD